jgi:CelD/BcsL family acetyltransferase involved in cellulose biosynthesis
MPRHAVRRFYGARRDAWDLLNLKGLPSGSPSAAALRRVVDAERYPAFLTRPTWSPYIDVRGSWDAFLKTRSVKFRKTNRNAANRIGRLDDVRLECFAADPEGAVLERLMEVSRQSWKHDRGIAISSTPESRRFFRALTRTGGSRGWLMIWLLSTEGVPIAMEYDLVDGGTVYGLRADFDERYGDYSPGKYLEFEIVKRLFEQGYREYSTGPGLNAYKLHWTSEMREGLHWNLCNANLRGMLGWIVEGRVAPALRRLGGDGGAPAVAPESVTAG